MLQEASRGAKFRPAGGNDSSLFLRASNFLLCPWALISIQSQKRFFLPLFFSAGDASMKGGLARPLYTLVGIIELFLRFKEMSHVGVFPQTILTAAAEQQFLRPVVVDITELIVQYQHVFLIITPPRLGYAKSIVGRLCYTFSWVPPPPSLRQCRLWNNYRSNITEKHSCQRTIADGGAVQSIQGRLQKENPRGFALSRTLLTFIPFDLSFPPSLNDRDAIAMAGPLLWRCWFFETNRWCRGWRGKSRSCLAERSLRAASPRKARRRRVGPPQFGQLADK